MACGKEIGGGCGNDPRRPVISQGQDRTDDDSEPTISDRISPESKRLESVSLRSEFLCCLDLRVYWVATLFFSRVFISFFRFPCCFDKLRIVVVVVVCG
ncbi:hypothetical protein Dimus_010396 [Dionaea muscipula]